MAKKNTTKTAASSVVNTPSTPISPTTTAPVEWYPWALAALAFFLYSVGFSNPMVAMDDHTATINNPAVTDFSIFGRFNLGMYAPVTWFFYAIVHQLNGGTDKATLYHVMSAFVHAFNVYLVYRLFRKWDAPMLMAILVSLFFAIHPLQTEAVSWIAGFSTPLFALFSFVALLKWTDYVKSGVAFSSSYWWALLAFLLACLSKSAAVMLPLSLVVLDIWWKRDLLKNALEKVLFFGISAGFGVLTLVSRVHEGHATSAESMYSPFERFFMACHSILFYWSKIIYPSPLSVWYPFTKTAGGSLPTIYFVSPVILAVILGLAFWKRKTLPLLWVGILFYLANIVLALPFSTLGTFELRSDRYNYIAILGILAILAYLPIYCKEKLVNFTNIAYGLLVVLGLFWLVQTVKRIGDWKDTLILLNKSMDAYGDNFGKAYYWRGMEIGDRVKSQKDVQNAISDFTKALEINPELTECYKYRGAFYGFTKQYDKSVADLTEYLKTKPDDAEYRFNRGLSYLNLKQPNEAIADMNQTLKDKPDFFQAYLTRSNAYGMLGDSTRAQADMKEYERRSQEQPATPAQRKR